MKPLRIIGSFLIFLSPVLSPAQSQMSVPYQAPDLSGYATNDVVVNAITNATPPDCPAPMPDALVASAGIQPRCMPRSDAVRATQLQRTIVTTAADGSFTGTWPVAFPSAPGWYQADIDIATATTAPYKCSFVAGAVTATSFSGKCVQLVATTLPATVAAVLGLTVSPFTNVASGLTVRVAGRL